MVIQRAPEMLQVGQDVRLWVNKVGPVSRDPPPLHSLRAIATLPRFRNCSTAAGCIVGA